MLTYDVVVATRNRLDAVALSLPMLVAQTRPPERIIVVDSSTDKAPMRQSVEAVGRTTSIPVLYLECAPGLTVQRNLGLSHVRADVVFFPDDDSLVMPDALERIMRVYERDAAGVIGGVCGHEIETPPPAVAARARASYRMTPRERIMRSIRDYRYGFEKRFAPSPLYVLAWRLTNRLTPPAWLEEENAVVVEHMTGFRMSFRSAVIRRTGFDEALWQYALQEDVDACLQTLRAGRMLVAAESAHIYHHKAPGGRGEGRRIGFMQVMNRAYLLAKHSDLDPELRRTMRIFVWYKLFQYVMGASTRKGRQQFAAAWAAWRDHRIVFDAPKDALAATYRRLCAKHLGVV